MGPELGGEGRVLGLQHVQPGPRARDTRVDEGVRRDRAVRGPEGEAELGEQQPGSAVPDQHHRVRSLRADLQRAGGHPPEGVRRLVVVDRFDDGDVSTTRPQRVREPSPGGDPVSGEVSSTSRAMRRSLPAARFLASDRPCAIAHRWSDAQAAGGATTLPGVTAREDLLTQITSKAVVHGRVVLSSGREADYYVDLRRVTLDGVAAPLVGEVMLELTADLDYDAVGGLTLGADPVAAAMLHAAAAKGRTLDAFVVRKEGKAHGLQRRIEGPDVAGRRVLAVEDTSTTGGSVLTAVEALREAGAEVVGVAVIVERGAAPTVEAAGLTYRAAYSTSDLGL